LIPAPELAAIRARFTRALSAPGIYLANHSLGRPPDRTAEDVAAALEAWYRERGEAWHRWLAARERFRALVAQLVGAPAASAIVPRASAGQGLRAVLASFDTPPRVLTTDEEFDSIDFVLRAWHERGRLRLVRVPARTEALSAALAERFDLVVVSTVFYASGRLLEDPTALVAHAHAAGALVLLDVYHHAGALPLDLATLDADFAVGGSYKYTRGGPGAAWLYVHPRQQGRRTLETGWFAARAPFAFERSDPIAWASGADAWLEATPAALVPFQALAGLEFTLEVGVARLRAHHLAQKRALAERLRAQGVRSEGADAAHGQFLVVRHRQARRLAERLAAQGIETDARGDRLRLGPDLLNTDDELDAAVWALGALLRDQAFST